jgi:hypothetical protein
MCCRHLWLTPSSPSRFLYGCQHCVRLCKTLQRWNQRHRWSISQRSNKNQHHRMQEGYRRLVPPRIWRAMIREIIAKLGTGHSAMKEIQDIRESAVTVSYDCWQTSTGQDMELSSQLLQWHIPMCDDFLLDIMTHEESSFHHSHPMYGMALCCTFKNEEPHPWLEYWLIPCPERKLLIQFPWFRCTSWQVLNERYITLQHDNKQPLGFILLDYHALRPLAVTQQVSTMKTIRKSSKPYRHGCNTLKWTSATACAVLEEIPALVCRYHWIVMRHPSILKKLFQLH